MDQRQHESIVNTLLGLEVQAFRLRRYLNQSSLNSESNLKMRVSQMQQSIDVCLQSVLS